MDGLRKTATFIGISVLLYTSACLICKQSPFELSPESDTIVISKNVITKTAVTLSIILCLAFGLGELCIRFNLPGLLGMLLAGILLAMPFFRNELQVNSYVSTVIRKFAFIVILLRGGLSLDGKQLKKLKFPLSTLSIIPSTVESIVVALLAILLLNEGLLAASSLGSLLSAVSPAVVVPYILDVQKKGLGSKNGVSTLIIASATVNDVFAITIFTILTGTVAQEGRSVLSILLHAPIEVAMGIAIGVIGGFLVVFIIKFKSEYTAMYQRVSLLLVAITSLFGSARLGSESMGAVAVLVLGFVAGQKMMRRKQELDNIKNHLSNLWTFVFQPYLFALIGLKLNIAEVEWFTFGLGCVIITGGLVARTLTAYLVVRGKFSTKERWFIALSWIPKATVQAALAPVFLELATTPELRASGWNILIVCIASILTTAPVGAFLIQFTAPRLLEKEVVLVDEESTQLKEIEKENDVS